MDRATSSQVLCNTVVPALYFFYLVVISLNSFTFSEFCEASTHHEEKPSESSSLSKIERSVDTKLQQRSALAEIQRVCENIGTSNGTRTMWNQSNTFKLPQNWPQSFM